MYQLIYNFSFVIGYYYIFGNFKIGRYITCALIAYASDISAWPRAAQWDSQETEVDTGG